MKPPRVHPRRHLQGSRNSSLLFAFSVLGPCLLSSGQTYPTDTFQLPAQKVAHQEPSQQSVGKAAIASDPHAPAAFNCFAAGDGIREGAVDKVATFEVVARDMFGDEHRCDPERFVVRVLPLTASHDEDQVQCHAVQGSQGCLTCRTTTACFTGLRAGACQYAYTPDIPGFFRVQIMTPSATGEGLEDIQGSPFRAHVEDGGVFLPGMSLFGYLALFLVSVGGALVLVLLFFAMAWKRWKRRQPPTEDDLEIARLERIAEDLEVTRQGREEREELLARLRSRRGAGGGDDDCWEPTDSSEDEEEEATQKRPEGGEQERGWLAHTMQGIRQGQQAWEFLQASAAEPAHRKQNGMRETEDGDQEELSVVGGVDEAWKMPRADPLLDEGDGGFWRPFPAAGGARGAFEIGTLDSDDEGP